MFLSYSLFNCYYISNWNKPTTPVTSVPTPNPHFQGVHSFILCPPYIPTAAAEDTVDIKNVIIVSINFSMDYLLIISPVVVSYTTAKQNSCPLLFSSANLKHLLCPT